MQIRTSLSLPLLAGLAVGALAPAADAQLLKVERVVNGLSKPLWVGSPPGDLERLFVCEQHTGQIRIIKDGAILASPFLDIGGLISTNNEQGLLGLAFHPDYETNGRFFVNYTNNVGNTRVVEYQVSGNPDVADPNPVQTILSQSQPFENHNGGNLVFGPFDGMLYIGLGDGGSANDPGNRAQTLSTNLGKMLRLDVDAGPPFIPADNPFVGVAGANDEIWAYGLRNPWRYSFDRETGDLYIGDVGQFSWEEVSFQPGSSRGGENYGWRCMEGDNCTGLSGCTCDAPALTDPIHEYANAGAQCSVTGGVVYRGSDIPALQGTYFFADYCSSRIWSFRYDAGTGQVTELTDRTSELEPEGSPTITRVTSFGEDAAGEIYIVDPVGGEIYKILPECGSSTYCSTSPNSVGPGALISHGGTVSVSANDLSLVAALAVPGEFGIFFYGPNQIDIPFGDGRLCVGGGLFRLNPPQQISVFGDVVRPVDYASPPMDSGPGMVAPGSTFNFQFWYRDPAGPGGTGFNTTDALNALFCP